MNGIFKQSINEITSYIQQIISDKQDPFGLSIALTNDEGLIWTEGFGFTDRSKSERVTPDTLFSMQSVGKCFTATAFLIMASKNMVNLDDSIREHYPGFTINTIFDYPENEIGKITFRRMLSHTAGFTHEALVGNNYDCRPCSFEEHIQSIGEGWLKSPVGSEMSYSNLGYDLTAYAMGLIHNKTFPEVMTEELFQPLGIENATFEITKVMERSFAKGYDGPFEFPSVQIPMFGAGGLFISAREAAKLIAFHLRQGENEGEQIVCPTLLEEMYKPQQQDNMEFGYGFGLYTVERITGAKVYGHGGGGYGYQTNMMWIPDMKIGVVVLSNNMKDSYVGSIAKKALGLMVRDTKQTSPPSILIENLSGTYVADGNLSPQLLRISSKSGKLVVSHMNGTTTELGFEGLTKFSSPNGTTYTFELDEKRKPKSIRIDDSIFPFIAKYNDGPLDDVGPSKMEWEACLGIYQFEEDARPAYMAVSIINGHLYLTFRDNVKLSECGNKVFFTAEGEVLTINDGELIYKGIRAKRVSLDKIALFKEIAQSSLKYDCYRFATSSLVCILYSREGIESTLDFIEGLIEIDERFKDHYENLGRRTYALGAYEDAAACIKALLEINPENEDAKDLLARINN